MPCRAGELLLRALCAPTAGPPADGNVKVAGMLYEFAAASGLSWSGSAVAWSLRVRELQTGGGGKLHAQSPRHLA